MEQNFTEKNNPQFAIRFGLGAIKAVGLKMMENTVQERKANGKFVDIYDFCTRLDPKSINKKSIEALAKSGSFDCFKLDRNQIAQSFEILASYSQHVFEAKNSNQMSLFGGINESILKPSLKKEFEKLTTFEKLQKEFESFGFFLNDHPLDELTNDLKKRGIAFSNNIDDEQIADNSLIKMAGVVLASKHRSSAKGRFAYLSLSDPMGIFEAMIFDENLITNSRDLLNDGSTISLECLIKKDEGGTRILVRSVINIDNFIKNTQAKDHDFIDIKKQSVKKNKKNFTNNSNQKTSNQANQQSSSYSSANKNNSPNIIVENEQKRIKAVELVIANSEIIKPLKIILDQKVCEDQDQVEIYFMVKNQDQEIKIKLANTYKIKDSDLIRFRNFSKNLTINVIYH